MARFSYDVNVRYLVHTKGIDSGLFKMSLPAPLDLGRMEAEAKENASKHISNLLQRPDQLEKVDQYKRRIMRKKASVDTMLKTAVQSQLDGVRTGLNQLQSALQDVYEIKQSLDEVEETYKSIQPIQNKLIQVNTENSRFCQLAAAMENLKHIFTVPESVRKTQELINEGKLLQAHKHLFTASFNDFDGYIVLFICDTMERVSVKYYTCSMYKAVEEREELLFVGEREEKETKEKIKTIRKNIEKLVLKLEQDCLDQLSISCRDNQLVLSESIEHFKEKTKMVLHCQNMLKAGLKCNSDIQLLYDYNNMKAQKEELESFLQVNEQQKYSKFAFEINGAMENMTNQITSLGNVVISEATLITSNSSLLDCSIRPLQDLDLLHENSFYKKEAKFSGVTCHDDMILLVDRYTQYWLYIFSDETDEIYYGRVKLSIQDALTFSIPWDVSGTLKGRCVVSFPESSVLADICINSCTINRWIQINNPQIGISFYSNSIVSCHRYDGKSADVVTIFDMNGNVIREHKHGCKPNYLCIDDVGRIFFNDRDENKLTCITYNFEEVFTYKHEQLRGIAGIATDTEGNIYVAGFNSNNVHQLSPSGQLNKIILTEAHDIINPLGISFKKDADILIVLNDSGSRVSMYEIY
ncbi:EXOC3 [Mytilus edulis]|uniref:EXOC3 n=1 Tax=Mytilus edulis TaxID=6550 RepID=A0A8S3U4F6_MYTED|nr:EXOC3 [Mytilus edulis]